MDMSLAYITMFGTQQSFPISQIDPQHHSTRLKGLPDGTHVLNLHSTPTATRPLQMGLSPRDKMGRAGP